MSFFSMPWNFISAHSNVKHFYSVVLKRLNANLHQFISMVLDWGNTPKDCTVNSYWCNAVVIQCGVIDSERSLIQN